MTIQEYFNEFKDMMTGANISDTSDPSAHNTTSAALVLAVFMSRLEGLENNEGEDIAAERTASLLNRRIPSIEPGLETRLKGLSKQDVINLADWFEENFMNPLLDSPW